MPKLILHFVYGLTDPRFSDVAAVRYIRVTLNPNQRFIAHLSCGSNGPVEKNAWIQNLHQEGLEPSIEIYEVFATSKKDSQLTSARETHWIRHYQNAGANLLNIQKMCVSENRNQVEKLLPLLGRKIEPSLSDRKVEPSSFVLGEFDSFPFIELFERQISLTRVDRLLEDGTPVYRIGIDDFFSLFLQRGAIGTGD